MPCYASQFQFRVNFSIYSSGFAIETHQDNTIQESDGNQRKIKCGTEKGNHKAKNHRTAGTTCKMVQPVNSGPQKAKNNFDCWNSTDP